MKVMDLHGDAYDENCPMEEWVLQSLSTECGEPFLQLSFQYDWFGKAPLRIVDVSISHGGNSRRSFVHLCPYCNCNRNGSKMKLVVYKRCICDTCQEPKTGLENPYGGVLCL